MRGTLDGEAVNLRGHKLGLSDLGAQGVGQGEQKGFRDKDRVE